MKLRLETAAMDALTVRLFDAIDERNMAWIMAADEALKAVNPNLIYISASGMGRIQSMRPPVKAA